MRRIAISLLSTFLFMNASGQISTMQLSPDPVSLNCRPSLEIDARGRVWVMFHSESGVFHAGVLDQGVWNELVSSPLPARLENPFYAVVDEAERVWVAYSDSGSIPNLTPNYLRVGYYSGGGWNLSDSYQFGSSLPRVLPSYALVYQPPDRIWYCFGYQNADQSYTFRARRISGGIVTTLPDLFTDANVTFKGAVGLQNQSVAAGYATERTVMGNSIHWYTTSEVAFDTPQANQVLRDCYVASGPGVGGTIGNRSWTLAVGGSLTSEIQVCRFRDMKYSDYSGWAVNIAYYEVFRANPFTTTQWKQIPDSVDYENEIAVSSGSDLVALAWFRGDSLFSRLLMGDTWASTSACGDFGLDTARRRPVIRVDRDSTAWIAYTAVKDGARKVFLSHIELSRSTEPTAVPFDDSPLPQQSALAQNFPNPFNPTTTVRYAVTSRSHVVISIYDPLGRHIRNLVDAVEDRGWKDVPWDARGIASGVYYCRMVTEALDGPPRTTASIRRMILLK